MLAADKNSALSWGPQSIQEEYSQWQLTVWRREPVGSPSLPRFVAISFKSLQKLILNTKCSTILWWLQFKYRCYFVFSIFSNLVLICCYIESLRNLTYCLYVHDRISGLLPFIHLWHLCLQSFAPLPSQCLNQIQDICRAGVVFLRDGATTVSATVCHSH